MQGKTKERWMELCEQAAVEQDPDTMLKLMTEINRLLFEKEERVKQRSVEIGLTKGLSRV